MVTLLLTCVENQIIKNLFQDHLNLRIKYPRYVKVIKIKSFDSYLYIYFPVKGCHIFYIGYHVSSNFIMLKLYKWHIFGRKCSQNYKKYFEYTIWSNSRQTKRMQYSLYVWMLPPNLLTPEALCLILYAFISYFICNKKKINESLGHFTTLTMWISFYQYL